MKQLLLSGLAIAVLIPGPASAQAGKAGHNPAIPIADPTVKMGRQTFDQAYDSRMRLREALSQPGQVAACLAGRAQAAAGTFVGGPTTSDPTYQALTLALSSKYKQCAPDTPIPLPFISGALAENLVRKAHPALQDRSEATTAAKVFAGSAEGGLTMGKLGRCLAGYSPGLAYRVLLQTAGSADEGSALANLYSQTPECGVRSAPPGIPTTEQRGSLAVGLYEWLHRS